MAGMFILALNGFLLVLRTRRSLMLENLALRHQLAVLQRSSPRPRLRISDRLLWVLLCRLWSGWANALSLVKPETVIRWHRTGFTRYWIWKSRRNWQGRPAGSPDVRALIRRMAGANPLWVPPLPDPPVAGEGRTGTQTRGPPRPGRNRRDAHGRRPASSVHAAGGVRSGLPAECTGHAEVGGQ